MALARHLMKDGATTDSYRMFALLSSLCQSPITWYTSGPAQKFILRQIRFMDTEQMADLSYQQGFGADANVVDASTTQLDVCLLMLYGHILFTSTSYTYALGMGKTKPLSPVSIPTVWLIISQATSCVHGRLTRKTPW